MLIELVKRNIESDDIHVSRLAGIVNSAFITRAAGQKFGPTLAGLDQSPCGRIDTNLIDMQHKTRTSSEFVVIQNSKISI